MGHQCHAKQRRRSTLGFVGVLDDFDATSFATSTSVDLGFHHNDATAETARRLARFLCRECHLAVRHGNTVSRQDGFCLILVNFHADCCRGQACLAVHRTERKADGRRMRHEVDGRRMRRPYTLITSTNSFTAPADLWSAARSSSLSFSSMICSIPRAPSLTGTPTNRLWRPYSP